MELNTDQMFNKWFNFNNVSNEIKELIIPDLGRKMSNMLLDAFKAGCEIGYQLALVEADIGCVISDEIHPEERTDG